MHKLPWSLFIVAEHIYPNGERSDRKIMFNGPAGNRLWHNVVFMDYEEEDAQFIVTACNAYNDLLEACKAAENALRSYQYGNSSSDLAEEIADQLQVVIRKAAETGAEATG